MQLEHHFILKGKHIPKREGGGISFLVNIKIPLPVFFWL